MKRIFNLLLLAMTASVMFSCTEVPNGYKGVVYKPYSGGLDPQAIYPEGVDMGLSWLWNDMIAYDTRQKTITVETVALDEDGLEVPISASVFHRVEPTKIGYLHLEKGDDYEETYIHPIFEGVLKDIIGKYSAQELVVSKRQEAQVEMKKLLNAALSRNHLQCDDVILQNIRLPEDISRAIEAKQVQDQKNLLAEKMKVEKENLAEAQVAEAKGSYEAAQFEAKTKDILSSPKMLKLKKVENEGLMWEGFVKHGKSPYGSNNMFGTETTVVRGLK